MCIVIACMIERRNVAYCIEYKPGTCKLILIPGCMTTVSFNHNSNYSFNTARNILSLWKLFNYNVYIWYTMASQMSIKFYWQQYIVLLLLTLIIFTKKIACQFDITVPNMQYPTFFDTRLLLVSTRASFDNSVYNSYFELKLNYPQFLNVFHFSYKTSSITFPSLSL